MKGVRIDFGHLDAETQAEVFTAIANGIADANAAFFRANEPSGDVTAPGVFAYESPRGVGGYQAIGDAASVLKRGRATCWDWAAFVAGWARAQGQDVQVVVLPVLNAYGRADEFHALVDGPSGLVDVCTLLRGYTPRQARAAEVEFMAVGACCMSCAYDGTLAQVRSCVGCESGSCGLHGPAVGAGCIPCGMVGSE